LLAAVNEAGDKKWYVEAPLGECLTSEQCLDFLLGLQGVGHKLYAYSFNYDLTKILTDLSNDAILLLFRTDWRQRKGKWAKLGPWPVRWNGFDINLQGTKFSVSSSNSGIREHVTLWDIWKFYQSKFVAALIDWKIGTEDELTEMKRMKDQRNVFHDSQRDEIRTYCFSECHKMAELAHKLVKAHEDAGLKLTSFYGAGSSASAMLKKMAIKDQLKLAPPEMFRAISGAFFGGRFENAMIGSVQGPVYNFDISSAYPYQLYFLPCLIHGEWRYTKERKDLDNSRTACVEYVLAPTSTKRIYWGPFPFRDSTGSICFPSQSGGGWIWKDEYLVGERNFSGVIFKGAWVYDCQCDCKPFADIPHYYRERCRIGKEGAGIVFKLGPNSCYGKLAQSVGNAPFNSWIWAGLITSGCRAQVLELIALHKDRKNIVLIATDGVLTREDVAPPIPLDTNTGITGKPLGGWERTVMPKGVFAARPGIYFQKDPTGDEIKKIRGRGVGKGVILENWKKIVDAWEAREAINVADVMIEVRNLERFCGAKSCMSMDGHGKVTRAAGGLTEHGTDLPDYGQWIKRRVAMSFDPLPKRRGVARDGIMLTLRKLPLDRQSVAYSKAIKSQERKLMEAAQQELEEQPDVDFVDFDGNAMIGDE